MNARPSLCQNLGAFCLSLIPLIIALCAVIVSAGGVSAGDQGQTRTTIPFQKAEVSGALHSSVTAIRKCDNYGWAAVLETMLRTQKVNARQIDLVTKTDSSSRCLPLSEYESLAQAVSGRYLFNQNQWLQVQATYTKGAPTLIDPLIVSLRRGQPLMMVWRKRAYLLYGIVYDDALGQSGDHIFYVRELKLLDPLVAADKPERTLSFVRDRDDPRDIDGIMSITVSAHE